VWSLKDGVFLMSASFGGVVTVIRTSWGVESLIISQIRRRISVGSSWKRMKAGEASSLLASLSISVIEDIFARI